MELIQIRIGKRYLHRKLETWWLPSSILFCFVESNYQLHYVSEEMVKSIGALRKICFFCTKSLIIYFSRLYTWGDIFHWIGTRTLLRLMFIVFILQENNICMVSHTLKHTNTITLSCQDIMKDMIGFFSLHFVIYPPSSLLVLFRSNSLHNLITILLLWSVLFRKKSELTACFSTAYVAFLPPTAISIVSTSCKIFLYCTY